MGREFLFLMEIVQKWCDAHPLNSFLYIIPCDECS